MRADETGEIERLVRTVERSPRFSVSFAVANAPLQTERLLEEMQRRLGSRRVVVVRALPPALGTQ